MADMTTEVQGKANNMASELKAKGQKVGKKIERITHDAGEKISTMTSKFANSAAVYVKNGEEYVQENPKKGVAIAAAAGLLAGSVLTLALRRRHG